MSKKIVAMLMAVAMAFSLLPVTVFAAEDTPVAPTTIYVSTNGMDNADGSRTLPSKQYKKLFLILRDSKRKAQNGLFLLQRERTLGS